MMKGTAKVFNGISIIGIVIIAFWIFQIDYNNLSFKNNSSAYLGITSMTMLIITMQLISRQIKNKK